MNYNHLSIYTLKKVLITKKKYIIIEIDFSFIKLYTTSTNSDFPKCIARKR